MKHLSVYKNTIIFSKNELMRRMPPYLKHKDQGYRERKAGAADADADNNKPKKRRQNIQKAPKQPKKRKEKKDKKSKGEFHVYLFHHFSNNFSFSKKVACHMNWEIPKK